MQQWDIYLCAKLIDSVYYTNDMTQCQVYAQLVNHDGYDPRIVCKKVK